MLPSIVALVLVGAPSLKQTAARNVEAFRKAILTQNVVWFERTYAPEFVQKVEGSAIDRQRALAQLRKGLLRMHVRTLQAKVVSVKPQGKGYEASVAFTGTIPATLQGRPATLTAKWRDEQGWIPVKGRWMLRSLNTHDFDRQIEAG